MSESPPSLPTNSQDLDSLSQEQRIQLAIKAIHHSGTTSNGQPALSLRQAAKDFCVPRSTLTDRFNGVRTRKEAHEHELNMTAAQEEVLAEWTKVMGRRGLPMTHATLTNHASKIAGKPVGLEECRARLLNPVVVNEFYQMLGELMQEYSFPAENIYNMDEKEIRIPGGRWESGTGNDHRNGLRRRDSTPSLSDISGYSSGS